MNEKNKFIEIDTHENGNIHKVIVNPIHIVHIGFGQITFSTPFTSGKYSLNITDEGVEKIKEAGWL